MTLGEIIKLYREGQQISQDALAARADISKAYISILERNVDPKTGEPPKPSIKTINALASAMGQSFNDVFAQLDDDFQVSLASHLPKRETPPAQPTTLTPDAQRAARLYDQADDRAREIVDFTLKPFDKGDTEFAAEIAPTIPLPAKKPLPLLLQAVAAGLGNFIDSNDYDEVEFENVPKRANIAVRITGDSMAPRFNPEDIVFVETDSVLDDGDIGIFRYDDNGYIKQLRLNPPRLVSLNKTYPDIMLDDNFDCRVIGRVLGKA